VFGFDFDLQTWILTYKLGEGIFSLKFLLMLLLRLYIDLERPLYVGTGKTVCVVVGGGGSWVVM
jgi:hypothetical protein